MNDHSMSMADESSGREQTYRGALALNNIAVSLMERGYFYDAIKTFSSALSVMSSSVALTLMGDVEGVPASPISSEAIKQMDENLRLARDCLIHSQKNPLPHKIKICPFDEGDVSTMKNALSQCGLEIAARFPVRLSCDSFSSELDLDLPSAAILYNHGLANLVAYEENGGKTSNTVEQPLQGALRSLFTARSMTVKHTTAPIDSVYGRLRSLLLDAVVLSNLFRVFWYSNAAFEANEVLNSLTGLLDDVQTCQDYLLSMNVQLSNYTTACAA